MQHALHRESQPCFTSWGANLLPSPGLVSHWRDWYMSVFKGWLSMTALGLHHFTRLPSWALFRLHIGMSLGFRQDLHKWADSFCIHIFLGTKVITSSLPCLQSPWHDQGNKVGLLRNMSLDQDAQNVLVWLNRILRASCLLGSQLKKESGAKSPKQQLIFFFGGYL